MAVQGQPYVFFTLRRIPKTIVAEAKLTVKNNGWSSSTKLNVIVDQYHKNPRAIEFYVDEMVRNVIRPLPWLQPNWLYERVMQIIEDNRQELKDVLSQDRHPF